MHKDQIKGSAKDMKGSMKESAGRAMGDREMESKGAAEKTVGKVQKGVGDIKNAARNALKH
jgi:uncharacterized protein YjbJ (UPF0337 family)